MTVSSNDNFIDPSDVEVEAEQYDSDIEDKKEEITLQYQIIENAKEDEDCEAEDDAREILANLDDELSELVEEGESIMELRDDCDNYARGSTLINENNFTDYIENLAVDCGDVRRDSWIYNYIDWDKAAEDSTMDYTTISFEGTDFYV